MSDFSPSNLWKGLSIYLVITFLGDYKKGKLIYCSLVMLSYQLTAEDDGKEGMGVKWKRGTATGEGQKPLRFHSRENDGYLYHIAAPTLGWQTIDGMWPRGSCETIVS